MDDITPKQAYTIINEASNILDIYYEKHPQAFQDISIYINTNLRQTYEGLGNDKYIINYLDAIVSELLNLEIARFS